MSSQGILERLFSGLPGKKREAAFIAKPLLLMATLWPDFPHFIKFANDKRISGIRLNSAKITNQQLEKELKELKKLGTTRPLYFDAKGRQPRVAWVDTENKNNLDIRLNHPISVKTPVRVLFKAGGDSAILERLEEGGQRLVFQGGPAYAVEPGESLHILHPSFKICGSLFTDEEKLKLEQVRKAGFTRYFLSYVERQRDIDEFRELVGKDTLVMLKIENQKGLNFVANEFRKADNLILVAARGDLFIELDWPHYILRALKLIIEKDPEACVGSRILLSAVNDLKNHKVIEAIKLFRSGSLKDENGAELDPNGLIYKTLLSLINRDIPSCADLCELAWLYDIGYRNMMLCDELCLREDLLEIAISTFEAFRNDREKK